METKISLPSCRMENIPVIGGFVITRVESDLPEIHEAAPDVDQEYLDGLKAQKLVVAGLVRPWEKTTEMKEVTKRIRETLQSMRPKLNLLEIKLKRAEDQLQKSLDAFGLTPLRKQIKKGNVEGVLSALVVTLHEVDANMAALTPKGFTPAMRQWFTTVQAALSADNDLQNVKIDERGELTLENKVTISDFWKGISGLMGIGRLLYKDNPVKLKEYTFAVLHRRVQAEYKHEDAKNTTEDMTTGMLSVTATNKKTGDPLEGVLVTVINRDITAETDEDGEGNADGIPIGKESISLAKSGFVEVLMNDLEIKAGEELEVDVEMEPEE
jgi:hypothetical protein